METANDGVKYVWFANMVGLPKSEVTNMRPTKH